MVNTFPQHMELTAVYDFLINSSSIKNCHVLVCKLWNSLCQPVHCQNSMCQPVHCQNSLSQPVHCQNSMCQPVHCQKPLSQPVHCQNSVNTVRTLEYMYTSIITRYNTRYNGSRYKVGRGSHTKSL